MSYRTGRLPRGWRRSRPRTNTCRGPRQVVDLSSVEVETITSHDLILTEDAPMTMTLSLDPISPPMQDGGFHGAFVGA